MSERMGTGGLEFAEHDWQAPELAALYNDVREYQRLLNETATTQQEQQAIINALDARWPYYGELITVTGRIATLERTAPPKDGEVIEPEQSSTFTVKELFLENEPVVSRGFNLYSRPLIVAEEKIGSEIVIGHYFDVRQETLSNTMFLEQTANIRGATAIDELIVELPSDPMSAIVRQLEYFYPQVAEKIDAAMLNAAHESGAVMALRDIYIPTGDEAHDSVTAVISQYVNALIEFDQRVPYQFALNGLFYIVDNEDPNKLVPCMAQSMDFWGYPKEVKVVPYAYPHEGMLAIDDSCHAFGLQVETLAPEADNDSGRCFLLPITNNMHMSSVRAERYASRQLA